MPASSATPAEGLPVQVRGLNHDYGGAPVLSALEFDLAPGRITAFLGRNGAGKSTTLAALAGLIQPRQGQIRVDGQDPARHGPTRMRIGFLPERPPLYPQVSVDRHLEFAARLKGLSGDACRSAVERTRSRFDLDALGDRPAERLSKGLQQRLGLAMAVVHAPRLVLLDEPGSGLDPVQLKRLGEIIVELGAGATVLYSTHMLNEALAVADELLVIHDGCLRHAGPTAELGPAPEPELLRWMSGEAPA